MREEKGYRSPAMLMTGGYPERSPYGYPVDVLIAALNAEYVRNPSLRPVAPTAHHYRWDAARRKHVRETEEEFIGI